MAESYLSVTPGTGLNLRTNTRTVSSTTVHEQLVLPGEGNAATYTAIAIDQLLTTSGAHLLIIQGDGTNYTRIRRITIRQSTLGTVATADIRVLRTTTAGTGGTTVNARSFDPADTSPYAGVVATAPTVKGTEGDQLLQLRLGAAGTAPITNANTVEWRADTNNTKSIILGTSTASGICIKLQTALVTVRADIEVEFVVTSFV
jgi:hypothetical protein